MHDAPRLGPDSPSFGSRFNTVTLSEQRLKLLYQAADEPLSYSSTNLRTRALAADSI